MSDARTGGSTVSLINSLRLGWPSLLVVLATFVIAEIATGTSWGGGPIGGVAGGIGVGGVAWIEGRYPGASVAQKRMLLSALAFGASVVTLTAMALARQAGVL